jgi:2-polyprenyl-6-methoxyphenol hydroxylase-like FAD-dependent oxidoreductase
MKLRILVVGGGIGGFAVAYTLGKRGHDVTILEDAPKLGEV